MKNKVRPWKYFEFAYWFLTPWKKLTSASVVIDQIDQEVKLTEIF